MESSKFKAIMLLRSSNICNGQVIKPNRHSRPFCEHNVHIKSLVWNFFIFDNGMDYTGARHSMRRHLVSSTVTLGGYFRWRR